ARAPRRVVDNPRRRAGGADRGQRSRQVHPAARDRGAPRPERGARDGGRTRRDRPAAGDHAPRRGGPGAGAPPHLRRPHGARQPGAGRLRPAPRRRLLAPSRGGRGGRVRALPGAAPAERPARGHALRRRAADAGDRPGPHDPPAPPALRRALPRSGPAAGGRHHHPARGAERAAGPALRGSRVRAGSGARGPVRRVGRPAGRRSAQGRLPRRVRETMSETSDRLLRGYQAQEKRFRERRFPLRFTTESPVVRELYRHAKGMRWNPETDVGWSRFDAAAYPDPVREAARLVWSRRAWGTYPGLGENTALLIRFCLESGAAGMDAKLFLSFRPAEEAKHLEACFLFARALGGYESTPAEAVARASNQPFAQMALDP